jgi:hypothetical protein
MSLNEPVQHMQKFVAAWQTILKKSKEIQVLMMIDR